MAVPPPSSFDPLALDPAKVRLREQARVARSAHVAAIGTEGARSAAEQAAALLLPHVPERAVVALYLAMHDEIDPAPLADALHRQGNRLALPALYDESAMRFLTWTPGDRVERGPMRLRQPLASATEIAPDLIVTPLVGFDRFGHRIGYGAGHYDRVFQRFPGAHRFGLAFAEQEQVRIPHDPWDVPLHAIVTERAIVRPL
jgi:5-formyltetrahydrofolate cyclo-ligase